MPLIIASTVVAADPSGSVTGKVTVPEGQKLPEMVVFLEPADAKQKPDAPKGPPVVVSQQNARFNPPLLVVPVGTQVDFRNDEKKEVEHNVFSNSEAKRFDLGLYKPGEKVDLVTFDQPGAVRLRCSIHRYMDGVVYVTPTPFFAVVDKDGGFAIKGVKPGKYRLKTWQRSQRFKEQDVAVTVADDGKPVELNVQMSRK